MPKTWVYSLGFTCPESTCLACSVELDRCSFRLHTGHLRVVILLTCPLPYPSSPISHMPWPPSHCAHVPIPSDPAQCPAYSRHLISISGIMKSITSSTSAQWDLQPWRASRRSCQLWG